jgi:Tfp pilus assembly protein PilF
MLAPTGATCSSCRRFSHLCNEGAALSILGQIAQDRGQLDEAEGYYRLGLSILQDVQDMLNYAIIALDLGTFLIQQWGAFDEGCALVHEAIRVPLIPQLSRTTLGSFW